MIDGVRLRSLTNHQDQRGSFAEMYRQEWFSDCPEVVQYQVLTSTAKVMRGVHVHAVHHDYLVTIGGSFLLGLRDMRHFSPSYGKTLALELTSENLTLVYIPPGVAHGFYTPDSSVILLGVSHYWDPEDELVIRWDDPDLDINWGAGVQPQNALERDLCCDPYAKTEAHLASLLTGQQ
ncbi:MAG: dTDP-4-dehydrorhamnose 3,5-epimerase family protein [Cyanobacteria bacterium J06638_7]